LGGGLWGVCLSTLLGIGRVGPEPLGTVPVRARLGVVQGMVPVGASDAV